MTSARSTSVPSAKMLDALVPGITARSHGLFPRVEEESKGSEVEEEGREDLVRAALLRALRELMGGLGTALEEEIRRLRYLGPLRSYPPRHLAFSQHHDPNWFAGGGYAWDVVRTDENVRKRVNAWLGDANRLKTPYELKVRNLLPAEVVSEEAACQAPQGAARSRGVASRRNECGQNDRLVVAGSSGRRAGRRA